MNHQLGCHEKVETMRVAQVIASVMAERLHIGSEDLNREHGDLNSEHGFP